ncbi:MAG: carboxypeptidase regulatory-like domain-containing protein [Pyrinomonadaceae bacterium]
MTLCFKNLFSTALIALCFGFLVPAGFAQETTGTITGSITDPNGAVVAAAQITISDSERGFERTYQTSDEGVFSAPLLPPGTYTVTIEAPGFKKYVQTNVNLSVNDRRPIDVQLEAGGVAETVTVTGEAALVQETPTRSGLVEGEQVRQLPLISRNFVQLSQLSPGVVATPPGSLAFGGLAVVNVSINGGRTSAVNYLVDGARNVDTGSNLTLLTIPSVDAIQEFTILTSNYAPEFGRNGGGVINVVTRQGTNDFNGTLYEFFRNDALNTRDPFITTPLTGLSSPENPRFKQPLRYNNFGFTIGGPVFLPRFGEGGPAVYNGRDRTFFFFSQEFRRIRATSVPVGTVATDDLRAGRIASSAALRDPLRAGVTYPSVGGIVTIPQDRIDPNARALLNFILPANERNSAGVLNQFRRVTPVAGNFRQEIIRFDHNFSNTTTFTARYIRDDFTRDDPGGNPFIDPFNLNNIAGTLFPGVAAQRTNTPGDNFVASLKFGLSPTTINEIAFDFARNLIQTEFVGTGLRANAPGFTSPELFPSTLQGALPNIGITNVQGLTFTSPQSIENPSYTVRDNLTSVRGNHTLKFGVFLSREAKNENAGNNLNGGFTFNGTRSGNAFADFLLGAPSSYGEDQNEVRVELRYNTFEFYAQDTWKITPRFTLDYGARYSVFQNPIELNDYLTSFRPDFYDPARAVTLNPVSGQVVANSGDRFNGIIFAGDNSPFGRRVQSNYRNTLGPRVGFAYNIFEDGRTVLRGGFGIYYDRTLVGIVEQNAFVNPRISSRVSIDNPTLANPSAGVTSTAIPVLGLISTGNPFKVPRTFQYSVGVQRELFRNAVLEVAYVGTTGQNLLQQIPINQPLPGARAELTRQLRAAGTINATTFPSLNAVRPFLGFGAISDRRTQAESNYNSLQVNFNKRFSRGFQFGAVYTLSKNITDASIDRTEVPQDPLNPKADRAVSSFDRTHVFTTNGVFELPIGQDRFVDLGGIGNAILGGFQISGIYTAQSGTPLTITQSISGTTPSGSLVQLTDPLGTGSTLRPNLVGDPRGTGTVTGYFNDAAFAPAFTDYGTAGRGIVRGPGINNFDVSIQKIIRFTEGVNLQLRAELFNAFNHPQFNNPNTVISFSPDPAAPNEFPQRFIVNRTASGSPNFGVITSGREPRTIQFGVKLNF